MEVSIIIKGKEKEKNKSSPLHTVVCRYMSDFVVIGIPVLSHVLNISVCEKKRNGIKKNNIFSFSVKGIMHIYSNDH